MSSVATYKNYFSRAIKLGQLVCNLHVSDTIKFDNQTKPYNILKVDKLCRFLTSRQLTITVRSYCMIYQDADSIMHAQFVDPSLVWTVNHFSELFVQGWYNYTSDL